MRSWSYRNSGCLGKILPSLCIVIILLAMVGTELTTNHAAINQDMVLSPGTPQRGAFFDYVVLIIMENKPLCYIVGSIVIGCAASTVAPYETKLAKNYTSGCRPLGQQLPFNYFQDIYNNSTRCKNLVGVGWPLNSTGDPEIFLHDLNSTKSASNFMWFSPSPCDQWHHLCTGYGATNQGDVYLSTMVPRILHSTIFKTQRAALFIVYDEGYGKGSDTCPIGRGDCVYAVWAGPQVKRGYMCGESYSHYSFLATLEFNWGLQNFTSNDGSARPMNEFFTNGPPCELQTGFTYNPNKPQAGRTVDFSGLVTGGTQPYSYSWNFGDGDPGTGQASSHTYQKAGKYMAIVTITDAAGQKI